ncbi:LLM class flavin-dependent oxidoreductase [Pseudonocardia bannensis]|uniref:LLM class flavin-dependent oxidoreductase n=1 Tax=Pseudonocardia bannensis TaxID=630973 RepID=A0A848DKA7_9PSEU|nr:LLM class flavin-dependent oxidoreductase [Pseudonocardia bannensis]NMH92995.1 LLM class flavin-dependent oxidoreductase [Pseudonocardia bannensis]
MKVTSFHFMPYRDLPDDFDKRYDSAWVDAPWWELGDATKVGDYYNWSLDELMHAAKMGFDGLGTNEHHQNVYGFMCNPNLFGAALAKMTRDQGMDDVALVQLGATVSSTSPPIRIAEEYAVLDCISGGRLVAGLPLGLGCDADISYGVTPIEQRERWREAIDLMVKAWTADEFFAWNGKYFQLPKVNLWPRPVQDPHPPMLIPGAASSSTWDYCHDRDLPYAYLSYFGGKSAENVMDRFWDRASAKDKDSNPYRASMLQLVGVAETDEQAHELYAPHIEHFYHKALHLPLHYLAPPGYSDYKSLVNLFSSGMLKYMDYTVDLKPLKAKDMADEGFVVLGSPATVREQLEHMVRRLNVGHLMVVLQFGSMPHQQAMDNIEMFGREVLPHLQTIWQDDGWENPWWPKRLNKAPVR